jgi:hypothetical protein
MRVAPKPPNGQANSNSYLLVFDPNDDSQAKAWKVAQQLAAERKLKQVLVGLLLAVHTVQEMTGKQIDLTEFMASFITGMVVGSNAHAMPRITPATTPDELPTIFAGTDNHADPLEAREAFSAGIGNLFDEEDDIWDD